MSMTLLDGSAEQFRFAVSIIVAHEMVPADYVNSNADLFTLVEKSGDEKVQRAFLESVLKLYESKEPQRIAARLLDYSFADIEYEFDALTETEKEIVESPENFKALVAWMKSRMQD